jgi:rubrerythrin
MATLKGSKTEANLKAAFAGESQARNRYTYFAAKALEDGYGKAAAVFKENAKNEKEHAKIWFKLLEGIGATEENLKAAASGENYEYLTMYPEFAKVAKEEGFDDIARLFESVAGIEKEHETQFKDALANLKKDAPGAAGDNTAWRCINCGHTIKAKSQPNKCPVCNYQDVGWSGVKAFKAAV